MSIDPISIAPVAVVLAGGPYAVHPTAAHLTRADDPFGPAVVIGAATPAPTFVVYDAQGRLQASLSSRR